MGLQGRTALWIGAGLMLGTHGMWFWVQQQRHMVSKEADEAHNPFKAVLNRIKYFECINSMVYF